MESKCWRWRGKVRVTKAQEEICKRHVLVLQDYGLLGKGERHLVSYYLCPGVVVSSGFISENCQILDHWLLRSCPSCTMSLSILRADSAGCQTSFILLPLRNQRLTVSNYGQFTNHMTREPSLPATPVKRNPAWSREPHMSVHSANTSNKSLTLKGNLS